MAPISGNVEVNSIPTLRVEVKVPTIILRMQNTLVMLALAVTTLRDHIPILLPSGEEVY